MLTCLPALWLTALAYAQDAPWNWSPAPDAPRAPQAQGDGGLFNGDEDVVVLAPRLQDWERELPAELLTISTWVAVERTDRWGGIFACVQDNGEAERGLVLGFDETHFTWALASRGFREAGDPDGHLTYLKGRTPIEVGRWHHVVGSYDGSHMRLYVDGQLDAEAQLPAGAVDYDPSAPLVVGAYRDDNENYPLDGRILEVQVHDRCLDPGEIEQAYSRGKELASLAPWTDQEFEFLVDPYLTWPTETQISVGFETSYPARARVEYWRDDQGPDQAGVWKSEAASAHHECRLGPLQPSQKYFYRVQADAPGGAQLTSELLSFRTASRPGEAFTFVVIGDTQTHGDVAKRVSDLAWMHRPNLVVHAGDLVDTGTRKRDWTDVFFPSMQPLIGRVPLIPVLGNHEQDADHYYRYMSLPEPERWYSLRFGDAEFFMIDGNRSLADQSAQLTWLEGALAASEARWRFAVLHQPPYTSDADDYGDTTQGPSHRGDPNVRNIVGLLEKYGVDICFSGHVHDYERTFPIRAGQVLEYREGGVIYVTAAGGGGHLEDFDPTNTWFGHKKARYHHLVYVALHGDVLEFQAIDQHGKLFDQLTLRKRGR